MRCKGLFIDDRVCDLCARADSDDYLECIDETQKIREIGKELAEIKDNCKYRDTSYDEYTRFWSCNLNGKGYGRNVDECNVKLECKQYKK